MNYRMEILKSFDELRPYHHRDGRHPNQTKLVIGCENMVKRIIGTPTRKDSFHCERRLNGNVGVLVRLQVQRRSRVHQMDAFPNHLTDINGSLHILIQDSITLHEFFS